jgi:hypothetical protein
MRNGNTAAGAAIATAAALLFGSLAVSAADTKEAKIHCMGVNSCKGQSACKTASNECRGHNSCKGQGFLEMTARECEAAKQSAAR